MFISWLYALATESDEMSAPVRGVPGSRRARVRPFVQTYMAAAGDEHPTVFPERPLLADIVDLVAALFRTPPFLGPRSIDWGVV